MSEQHFNQELSRDLINQITNLVDGNQANKNDIQAKEYSIEPMNAKLFITWVFFAEHEEYSCAGGSYIGTRCNSINELESTTSDLKNFAKYSKELRTPFISNFKTGGREAIKQATQTHSIKDFGNFSTKDDCHKCRGSGKRTCSSCGGSGKNRCSSCSGTGTTTQYRYNSYTNRQESYSTTCNSCGGSGNTRCSSCSGSGNVRCGNCNGYGYFTVTRHIEAKAKPLFAVKTDTVLNNDALEKFLSTKNILFINDTIYFEPHSSQAKDADEEQFIYIGSSTAIKQKLSVKEKEYTCYAYSNPPIAYIRPAIFDDLFADELEFLDSAIGQKKYISKKKALEFFDTYSGQPALDKALKNIASERKKNKENTTHLVQEACNDFISKESAEKLSNHINKFMDKVSPSYSPITWWFGVLLLIFIDVVFFEYAFEHDGTKYIFGPIIAFAIIAFAIIAIIYPVNLLITWIKRRHIPKEYRQNIRHFEPMKTFLKIGTFIFLLVGGYGILANKDYLPKTNGLPLYITMNSINNGCDYLEENNITVCRGIDVQKHMPNLVLQNMSSPKLGSKSVVLLKKSYFHSKPDKSSKTKNYLVSGDRAKLIKTITDTQGKTWYRIQYYSNRTKKLFDTWIIGSSAKVE